VTGAAVTTVLLAPARVPAAAAPAHPTTRLARWRLTRVAISVAAVALPLLRPSGPGNTGLVDLALLGAMLFSALWASVRSLRLRVPYALPVGLTVLAGALAVTVSGAAGGAAGRGLLAIAQDVFVLGWAAAIATVGGDERLLDTFCRAWAYSATAWAGLLIVADIAGINWLSGVSANDGIRASFTLGDPNLAANYFLCGLLVMRATRRPRRAGWRFLACAVTLTALVLTLSNGGMLALLIATVLGALFGLVRRRGLAVAALAAVILITGAGVAVATVDLHGWVTRVEESSPLVRDSIGRQGESGGSRSTLAHEAAGLWLGGGIVLGVGPGGTEPTLRARQAPYVKEAHDDYLAALVERGVLGGLALVLLIAAVTVRSRRIARVGGVSAAHLAVVPRPELLVAAVVAVGVSAMFYEVLHFRHVWALLGLVAVLELSGQRR
jgi:O-antigen ligase/polysaccharide polymerase Wzy-like membrane protein